MPKVKLVTGKYGGPARSWSVGPPLFSKAYIFQPDEDVEVAQKDFEIIREGGQVLRGRVFETSGSARPPAPPVPAKSD